MKLIIDIPDSEYKQNRYYYDSVYHGIPLKDVLKDVKFQIEHMACKQYEHRLTLDRQEVIDILDNIGKESEEN